MYRRLVLLVALIAFFATSTEATSVLRGKRSRKYSRRLALVNKLQQDKLRIYKEYGFPVHRLRVNAYGRIHEHWTYYEHGREFVFDDESKLVKTNRFWPENRRERFERYPGYQTREIFGRVKMVDHFNLCVQGTFGGDIERLVLSRWFPMVPDKGFWKFDSSSVPVYPFRICI